MENLLPFQCKNHKTNEISCNHVLERRWRNILGLEVCLAQMFTQSHFWMQTSKLHHIDTSDWRHCIWIDPASKVNDTPSRHQSFSVVNWFIVHVVAIEHTHSLSLLTINYQLWDSMIYLSDTTGPPNMVCIRYLSYTMN